MSTFKRNSLAISPFFLWHANSENLDYKKHIFPIKSVCYSDNRIDLMGLVRLYGDDSVKKIYHIFYGRKIKALFSYIILFSS